MERIWGGRRLESEFGKNLPDDAHIGEAWEIVDRAEAQSVVRHGPLRDQRLHDLWMQDRQSIFGDVSDSPRFPLLIKLLDAHDRLSLQVHPPEEIASSLGGEPKTEFWYIAAAQSGAKIYAGLRESVSPNEFATAVRDGKIESLTHALPVRAGDAMFLPSGRFHAIGGGIVLFEIQQNSDTTYRVFDWNRKDEQGKERALHVDQAVRSIDFDDTAPQLVRPEGEQLVRCDYFEIQKWMLDEAREIAPKGEFAIIGCLTGGVRCVDVDLRPGEFALVPACLEDRQVHSRADDTALLRVTIPR